MQRLVVLCALAVAVAMAGTHATDAFSSFKAKYHKRYADGASESAARAAFDANLVRIELLSRANPHAKFGITRFADLTQEQFRRQVTGTYKKPSAASPSSRLQAPTNVAIPAVLDWVTKGAVTPVQDQGQCGSDWAFSAVGNIEGVNFVQNNVLTPLSVEELLDCDTNDNGCNGGFMTSAFEWLLQKQGGNIMTDSSWPYMNGASNCTYVGKTVGATLTSYQSLAQSEATLTTFTATYGPIAVAVDATSWQLYESGVLTDCTYQSLDHGVLVVGYNNDANPPYWILKNTWGTEWGMNGYIYVEKGVNACGIKEDASTAFVQKYI